MTLDAMHWVWNHSQSKGNARLALLAVADRVRTPACEVRVSYSEFMTSLNAGRSVVRDAVRCALDLGELELVEPGKGTRSAVYRLPKAVGYVRGDSGGGSDPEPVPARQPSPSGRESEPQRPAGVPESEPPARASGSQSEPLGDDFGLASGSDSGTEWFESRTASGSKSGTHYPSHSTRSDRSIDPAGSAVEDFPAFARPLADQMTLAGVVVRWPFNPSEWVILEAAISRSGIPTLVDYARRTYERRRGDIDSARFFLSGWCQLPPAPAPGTERPPLRAVGSPGWQPYTNPTDRSVYENGWNRS